MVPITAQGLNTPRLLLEGTMAQAQTGSIPTPHRAIYQHLYFQVCARVFLSQARRADQSMLVRLIRQHAGLVKADAGLTIIITQFPTGPGNRLRAGNGCSWLADCCSATQTWLRPARIGPIPCTSRRQSGSAPPLTPLASLQNPIAVPVAFDAQDVIATYVSASGLLDPTLGYAARSQIWCRGSCA